MPSDGPTWRVHAIMVAVVAAWGGAFTAIKVALEHVTPAELTVLRFAVAAPVLVLILAVLGWPRFERREWPSLGAIAVLSVAAYHLALNYGETAVSAGTAALIVASVPIWTALLSALVLRERITPRKVAGIALALTGVVTLVVGQGEELSVRYATGAFLVLLAPMAWAVSSVLSKPLLARHRSEAFTAATTLLGTLPLLPLLAGTPGKLADGGTPLWSALLFLGLLATAGGYLGFNYALRQLTPTQTTTYVYLNPVFGVLWGYLLLREPVTLVLLGAGALVIAGVALTNSKPRAKLGPKPLAVPSEVQR